MRIVKDAKSIGGVVSSFSGCKIGLVPTMGALHSGHLSLVHEMKKHADKVILSIFVNPMQFSPGEDYEKYPRCEEEDCAKCAEVGVDVVYIPSVKDMYPDGFSTSVDIGPMARELCGASRRNFMNGIMIVLIKLVMQTKVHCLILGEKDYQMLCLTRKLFRDLNIDVQVLQGNTVRSTEGLALSSRHKYLSDEEIAKANFLYGFLLEVGNNLSDDPQSQPEIIKRGKLHLEQAGFKVDYLEVRDNNTLERMPVFRKPARVFLAVYLGCCRLIDNILVA
ncbi:pantoate--beta-alanine ligase [Anaplasma capra]|uniref:pantoate--beta-alanine ligase n=1 Tax=Anaplasma capra TaxID=1562740 RepID=UPI0021D5A4AF|nr:pantoate--beta-alanine ligase [Anaplasma capra]MCU7611279.1 pantoate--beta-alanine ligase [Anaplasma capra]MCU7612708.1 pantoate--beta-alanine ligase [Anaplasma capra]